jgi:hypothetical protein
LPQKRASSCFAKLALEKCCVAFLSRLEARLTSKTIRMAGARLPAPAFLSRSCSIWGSGTCCSLNHSSRVADPQIPSRNPSLPGGRRTQMAQTSIAGVKINPLFIWRSPERNHSRHTLRRQQIDKIRNSSKLGITFFLCNLGPGSGFLILVQVFW